MNYCEVFDGGTMKVLFNMADADVLLADAVLYTLM